MSDDSDPISPTRIDLMKFSIIYFALLYEVQQCEIPVDRKTADRRDNLCRHNRLRATFIYDLCTDLRPLNETLIRNYPMSERNQA